MSVALVENGTLDKMDINLDTYMTLKRSIFPGAKDESIHMAVAYCRAAHLDILHKPVHIVPMSVKDNQTGRYEFRDVIMPGIAAYRIQASRSGAYVGKSEPEFGPDVTEVLCGTSITYPLWCKVVVKRLVDGNICEFVAKEYWKENVATNKAGQVNAIWQKRPYGQLAKCTEAQGVRMAFPELTGGLPTAEEMEGKTGDFDRPTPAKLVQNIHANKDECIDKYDLELLKDKLSESETEEIAICNHLHIDTIESMSKADFPTIIVMLNRKIEKKNKNASLAINQIFENKEVETEAEPAKITEEAKEFFDE